jgi:hypothetical protein
VDQSISTRSNPIEEAALAIATTTSNAQEIAISQHKREEETPGYKEDLSPQGF